MNSVTASDVRIPQRTLALRLARLMPWVLSFLAPFVFILAMDAALLPLANPDPAWRHETASFVASPVATPRELPATGWRAVELPFRQPKPAVVPSSAWYRIPFDGAASDDELWAVYFARPYSNLAVFINGTFIGDSGSMVPPIPMHRGPLLYKFPARLLHAGDNVLDVRSVHWNAGGRLDVAVIGPAMLIEPAFRFTKAMAVTVKQFTVIMMLAMSAVMAVLFSLRRRESAYGWFAAALLFWAAHIEIMLIAKSPFRIYFLWDNLQGIAIGAYVVCAAFFVHRFLGLTRPRAERLFLFWGVSGALVLLTDVIVFGYQMPWFFKRVWMPGIQLIGVYQLWTLLSANRRRQDLEVRLLAIVSWFVLVVGVRDGWVDIGWLQRAPLYLTYTVGAVLFVFGTILLRQFAGALNTAERTNEQLEQRVREKAAELERNLVRLKDLERERALSAERERIMQDMHDGVGGHLVQALSIASVHKELEPVAEPLRTCLDELRLMIDSIEPVDGDLASVLGTLRMRMSRRLAQAGVEMRWDVADLPPLPDFGPKRVLEVTRIVQEAITNALKHSHARQITVSARELHLPQGHAIAVEIADDGRGFSVPSPTESSRVGGRGLSGMRRRAAELGGSLRVESSDAGTRVRLELPLDG